MKTSTLTDKLFDVAVILGFVSAVAYLVGYAYFWSFLTRLSLRPLFVQVAPIEYLWQAFMTLFFLAMLIFPAAFVAKKPPATFVSAAIGNLPIFVLMGVMVWGAIDQTSVFRKWMLLAGVAIFAINVLRSSYRKKSVAHYIYSGSILVRASSIGATAFLALLVAFQLGSTHATKLIEGTLYASTSVKLCDKNGKDLLGQGTWLLVLIDQSNYIVVQKSVPVPEFPIVRLISKGNVSVAKIQRMK